MPVLHNLPLLHPNTGEKPDWAMVDECQDLCPTERLMVEKISPRTISVGDPNQSIYAFKGADPDSMAKLRNGLHADELPLSICYRCSKAVIAEAQKIVPGIMAAPSAVEGSVGWIDHTELLDQVQPGNYVLCRTTAPLVKECMKMLAQGRKATVKGKDIGKSLAGLIDMVLDRAKLDPGVQMSVFWEALQSWVKGEKERLEGQDEEDLAQGLDDKVEAIGHLTAGAQSPAEAMAKIDAIFSDEGGKDGVTFSTVHKAKGMEADDVFIMRPDLMPHPKAQGKIAEVQEENIKYVAITRAKKNLRWVSPPPPTKSQWESKATSGKSLYERLTGKVAEDKIPGGKGDNLKTSDVDPLELAKGVEVEGEHTKNKALATEIALDHLRERKDYYTRLLRAKL
jgi:ATP-dependent exoDNAse (exonuclease V) beta subunit